MTESELQRIVLRMIKSEFPEAWFYKASDKWISGIPDILGCLPGGESRQGLFFAMELKTEKGRVTRIQEYVMKKIDVSGGRTRVVRSVEEARDFLLNLKKGGN